MTFRLSGNLFQVIASSAFRLAVQFDALSIRPARFRRGLWCGVSVGHTLGQLLPMACSVVFETKNLQALEKYFLKVLLFQSLYMSRGTRKGERAIKGHVGCASVFL
jgi:hypothetical protein